MSNHMDLLRELSEHGMHPDRDVAQWAIAEIERLTDIVDKLPKTADGVCAVHGMPVYLHDAHGRDDGRVCVVVSHEGGYGLGWPAAAFRRGRVCVVVSYEGGHDQGWPAAAFRRGCVCVVVSYEGGYDRVEDWSSTREAAEAAKKAAE